MKGISTISLKGEEIQVKFTIGVVEDFQDYLEENDIKGGVDQALGNMKHLRKFLHLMSKYAGDGVSPDEFKHLEFDQMEKALSLIEQSSDKLGNLSGATAPT